MAFSKVEMMTALTKKVSRKMLKVVRLRKILQVKPTAFASKVQVEFKKNRGVKNDSKVLGLNKQKNGGEMRRARRRAAL